MKTFRLKPWHFVFTIILFTIFLYIVGDKQIMEPVFDHSERLNSLEGRNCLEGLAATTSFVLFTRNESDLCRLMESNFSRMINSTEKNENVSFYRIETDSCPDACVKYGISGIPTILILKNGKEEKRIMGIVSVSNLSMIYRRTMKEE